MPIHDQSYQHWQGNLRGHGWRWLVVAQHGVRIGMRNWFLRLVIIAAWLPALSLAAMVCLWGMVEDPNSGAGKLLRGFKVFRDMLSDPREYRGTAWTLAFHLFILVEMYVAMFLVLLVGPALISRDLRFNALPLYFSRPVRRLDYFLGKLGTIGFFLFLVTVVPAIIAWILGVLFSMDVTVIADTFRLLLALIVHGVIVTVSAGLLILAMSSLTRNSGYVVVLWAGFWLITSVLSTTLQELHWHQVRRTYFVHYREADVFQVEINEINLRLSGVPGPGQLNNPPALLPEEREKLLRRRMELEHQRNDILSSQFEKAQIAYEQEQKADWRPLLSYTSNLQRIGFALIGSRAAWEKVDELREKSLQPALGPGRPWGRSNYASNMAPSYPWYWSASVLLALGVLSVCILNQRVKTLDRLR